MRNRLRRCAMVAVMLIFCASSGCDFAIGPKVRTDYVVMHPGRPLQILENVTVKGRILDGDGDAVEQDVGGWVVMPPDHWAAVQRSLEAK